MTLIYLVIINVYVFFAGAEFRGLTDHFIDVQNIRLTRGKVLVLILFSLSAWWVIQLELLRRDIFDNSRKENSDDHG